LPPTPRAVSKAPVKVASFRIRPQSALTLVVAALAMVATLPGRTVGLGLITEEILVDLELNRSSYAGLNLVATFLGALFLFGAGPALDRHMRLTTFSVLAALSGAVFWMANLPGPTLLLLLLILSRGLGQSCLSLCSVGIVAKTFQQNLGKAMGVFAVITALLFVAAIPAVGSFATQLGWRKTWMILSAAILGIGILVAVFIRNPQTAKNHPDDPTSSAGMRLGEALRSPLLWVLTIGIGIFYFAFTGITLFSESLLVSLEFDTSIRDGILAMIMGFGLVGNLTCGWLVQRTPVMKVFGIAMLLVSGCLFGFPLTNGSVFLIFVFSAALGIGSGAVTVVFFAGFADLFGKKHLGKIQGAAQAMTVAASAIGPVFFAWSFETSGSYSAVFFVLAPLALMMGLFSFLSQGGRPSGE
jgi:MFS family permease